MKLSYAWFGVIPIIITAARLVSFGRWVWGRGQKGSAVGIYIIAAVTVVFPMIMLIRAGR